MTRRARRLRPGVAWRHGIDVTAGVASTRRADGDLEGLRYGYALPVMELTCTRRR